MVLGKKTKYIRPYDASYVVKPKLEVPKIQVQEILKHVPKIEVQVQDSQHFVTCPFGLKQIQEHLV